MPTNQPPVPGFVAASFEPGPFSQYLQQPAAAQTQALVNQGTQWSGREGALGVGAGLLSKFIAGASAGRARALAQQHENQMQAANSLNQFTQAVNNSDLLPEDKSALNLQAQRLGHEAMHEEIVQAGKKSPFMKALGTISEAIMGGPPPGQYKDPVTGQTIKQHPGMIRTAGPGGLNELWAQLGTLPTASQKYQADNGNLFQQTTDAFNNLRTQLGRTPSSQEMIASNPELWKTAQQVADRYRRPSAFHEFIGTLPGQIDPMKAMEMQIMADAYGLSNPNAQEVITRQAGQPAMQAASTEYTGPEGIATSQPGPEMPPTPSTVTAAPPGMANVDWNADHIDPGRLQKISRISFPNMKSPVEELRAVIWDDKDRKSMHEDFIWRDPAGNYRDDKGNKIDPDLVDRRSLSARGGGSVLQRMEIHDPGAPFGHSNAVYNTATQEWSRPKGDKRDLPETITRFYGNEGDAAVAAAANRQYVALEEKRAAGQREINQKFADAKRDLDKRRDSKDPLGQPLLTQQQYADNLKALQDAYYGPTGFMKAMHDSFNNAQKAIERDPYAALRGQQQVVPTAAPPTQAPRGNAPAGNMGTSRALEVFK